MSSTNSTSAVSSAPSTSSAPPSSSATPSSTPSSVSSSVVSTSAASSTPPSSSSTTPPSSSSPSVFTSSVTASSAPPSTNVVTSVFTATNGNSQSPVTQVITVTSVQGASSTAGSQSSSATSSSTTTTPAASLPSKTSTSASTKGLTAAGRTAIAVVVPVVVVALLVLAGIFLWRKRKQRKNAAEARRKEVEDYGYNPNNDPTLPAVGGVAGSEMMEDSSGYRGWGNTTNPSNRKTSTTVSGGHGAFSDTGSNQGGYRSPGSPTQGTSDAGNSGDPLVGNRRATLDSDGIGALGAAPAAGANRTDIRHGPSNASSSYSAGNHSESSDGPMPIGSPQDYYHDNAYYQSGPYGDGSYGGGQQPIIRDVSARRNTRIENPSVFPHQGNSGIAQNF